MVLQILDESSFKPIQRSYFIAIGALLISFVFLFWKYNSKDDSKIKFSSIIWKEDKRSRYRMVDDLIEKKTLLGKRKTQVINLLGSDYIDFTENSIRYNIYKSERQFTLDHWELIIEFKDDTTVFKAYVLML